jgi:hypothetical protein
MRKPRRQQTRPKDLVGQDFGRLHVIGYEKGVGRRIPGKYICSCFCGGTAKTQSKSLTSGSTKSCGCLQKERAAAANALRPYEALYNHLLHVAQVTKRAVTFSYEKFLDYTQVKACHYCLTKIAWDSYGYNLDRKNNALDYTEDNVVVCCSRCNRGKSNVFTYAEWWRMTECFRKDKHGIWP